VGALRDDTDSRIRSIVHEYQTCVRGTGTRWCVRQPGTGRVNAFSGEADADVYGPFEALGYAKSGMVTKAPPRAMPASPSYFYSVWGMGSVDHEERDGPFIGIRTTTYTGIGGADLLRIGINSSSDALLFGILGSGSRTHVNTVFGDTTRATTPAGGLYAAYINGGFSTDVSFIASFTRANGTEGGAAFTRDTDSYTTSANVQYKYDVTPNWWFEPTVGASYTQSDLNVIGFEDGHTTRLQGGARFGTEWTHGTVKVQPTLTGIAYSDVILVAPHPPGAAVPGIEEGKLFGKGSLKINFVWTDKFSTFVEGEVRGSDDIFGVAGRFSARYTF